MRQIVRHRESIHPRRHAVLRRLVAQLDDLLDHLAFRLMQRALLRAQLDQRPQLILAEKVPRLQRRRRHRIGDLFAQPLQQPRDGIKDRRQHPHHPHPQPREPHRICQCRELRHQVADENDERENQQRLCPVRHARPFQNPQQVQAQNDQRQIHQRIGEQDRA